MTRVVRPVRTHIMQGGQTMAGAPIFQILQVGLESPDNTQLQSGGQESHTTPEKQKTVTNRKKRGVKRCHNWLHFVYSVQGVNTKGVFTQELTRIS